MMIELVLAMMFLAIAAGSLVTVYSSSIASLARTSTEGTALTLVDRQIELYNTLRYDSITLAAATIPNSTDPYVGAHASDPTIPSATGQVTGAVVADGSCTAAQTPQPSCATQTVIGPDHKTYRIDVYIVTVAPPTAGSRSVKQVTAVARVVRNGAVGPIRARVQSAYDQCNPPSVSVGSSC